MISASHNANETAIFAWMKNIWHVQILNWQTIYFSNLSSQCQWVFLKVSISLPTLYSWSSTSSYPACRMMCGDLGRRMSQEGARRK